MDEEAKEMFSLDRTSECDNCGYRSIVEKNDKSICPNCGKNKLLSKGI